MGRGGVLRVGSGGQGERSGDVFAARSASPKEYTAPRPSPRHLQVYFHRKAQLLAAQLHLRFRGADERFRFADMPQLAVDSGCALPAVLRRRGVLELSSSLAEAVDSGGWEVPLMMVVVVVVGWVVS